MYRARDRQLDRMLCRLLDVFIQIADAAPRVQ
jgi:hypothetical protein